MSNKYLLELLLKKMGNIEYDFMGQRVYDIHLLTFHHIIKQAEGGKDRADNGALLMPKSHTNLHIIELYDQDLYEEYTYWFTIINRTGFISPEILEIMKSLNERMNIDLENKNVLKKELKLQKKKKWKEKEMLRNNLKTN